MKIAIAATILAASSLSFAIVAPAGEYIDLSCKTNQADRSFTLNVIKDSKTKKIKMVLETKGQAPQVYPNVKETIDTRRPGAPVVYSAAASGGRISLSVNFTTTPNPKGRRAVLTSVALGRPTQTEMLCNRVMY